MGYFGGLIFINFLKTQHYEKQWVTETFLLFIHNWTGWLAVVQMDLLIAVGANASNHAVEIVDSTWVDFESFQLKEL